MIPCFDGALFSSEWKDALWGRFTMGAPQSLPSGLTRRTAAVRRAIHHSQESLRSRARRYAINQKTVAKWKNRTSVSDLPTGPKEPHSTVLSLEDDGQPAKLCYMGHALMESRHGLAVDGGIARGHGEGSGNAAIIHFTFSHAGLERRAWKS